MLKRLVIWLWWCVNIEYVPQGIAEYFYTLNIGISYKFHMIRCNIVDFPPYNSTESGYTMYKLFILRHKWDNFKLKPCSHAQIYTRCVKYTHIIICTRVYFWACERNCIYVKVNLHICKYTPTCKYTPAQTRCILAFTYMYFIHICIFGHVDAQQIYTRMQM